ncbi:MAG: hypothetical protein WB952_09255 [Terriglobales bacterium]
MTLFLAGFPCLAQEQSQTSQPQAAPNATVTIPAGTRIALVLTHPIQSRHIHRGDDIYAQITSPITSGHEVVIPPGAFVQGKVDKLDRKRGRGELHLQSLSITFPDGYVAPVAGPLLLESDEGYALTDPGKGRVIAMFALPGAGLGLGALIGHAAGGKGTDVNGMNFNSGGLKSTAIGSIVGLAVGGVASLALLAGSHNFYLDVGSPVDMVLQQPLSLQQHQSAGAGSPMNTYPVEPIAPRPQPQFPTSTGTCFTPGTPGTPPAVIPGTPPIGGSPGTPDIVIPGTPAIPGTPIPCP